MNIVYITLGTLYDLNDSTVHIDLIKRFAKDNDVWVVCKNEGKPTTYTTEYGIHVLRVRTGELKKVGMLQKGIATIMVEPLFKNAIRKYLKDIRFDIVIYTTPPITFASSIKYLKNKDNPLTYLMLKDIFPQNAVDLGILKTTGIHKIIYRYFRNKEIQLYSVADFIGCMSQANLKYIIKNNPYLTKDKIEICPNTTVIQDMSINYAQRTEIRKKYGIPLDKTVYVYGGNLGKPQDIPFIIDCLRKQQSDDSFFLIIGQGTEYTVLKEAFESGEIRSNCKLMSSIPKPEYETLVAACDIGMIFLDHRFTIPNFPSRLLSYLKSRVPVLAVTDQSTDVGEVITSAGFGFWCESNDVRNFLDTIKYIGEKNSAELKAMGDLAFDYLEQNYCTDVAFSTVMKHIT